MQLNVPDSLPAALEPRFRQVQSRVSDLECELPAAATGSAARVLIASNFVLETLSRQPESLVARLADDTAIDSDALAASLELADRSEPEAMGVLRRRRNVELAAIAWRDIAGLAGLDRTLADLSALADGMIGAALDKAVALLEPRFGRPGPLLVLGMGKLGGRELNFSSDVDLVFLYPDPNGASDAGSDAHAGSDAGEGAAGNAGTRASERETESGEVDVEDYYRRLSQRLVRLLDERTADGIVFRVDTRLRPFGKSGPLALSIGAFESYLVKHGRDWERYAYIKARLITGQDYADEVFGQVLTPFVYRRYLDFGVFDALRQMKRLISQEVERKDKQHNIKLGRGGIREVEFIAQMLQLVRGGQEPGLRERNLLAVLTELAMAQIVEPGKSERLAESYRFLRTAENRLQELEDQQTHEIPREPELRERWAYAMGFPAWADLDAELERHRDIVQAEFDAIGWEPGARGDAETEADSTLTAWDAGRLAETTGNTALEPIDELRKGGLYRRMDETSRQRLRAFVGKLVPALDGVEQPADALNRIMPVIQSVCRRSAYLSLLLENPSALERLLSLAGHSAMLARLVAEHPLLLDELLDPRLFDAPPTRAELEAALANQIEGIPESDTEALLNAMRAFQRAAVFRVAIADRFGGLPLMKVSDRLTDIAELVLDLALRTAKSELEAKHGVPMHGEEGELTECGLAVIAYGKLGGLELGYGSDLDLVFLHDSDGSVQESTGPAVIDNQRYFVRLVQRVIHFLSVQTSSGRLYEIDTRLRPSGASGLLVGSLTSFTRYQREEAWTWEHQALLRSRSVAGPPALCAAFERVRIETLTRHVDRSSLRADVAKMRTRMRKELATGTAELFDVKQDPGGLADIEFLIDYWVLANAPSHEALVTYPDNVRQLEALEAAGLVPAETCASLKQDYLTLRQRTHELALSDGGRRVPAAEFEALRRRIRGLWERTFGDPAT